MLLALDARVRNGELFQYRQKLGLSQTAAARRAGVGLSSWNSIECLRFNGASWGTICHVAEFLGVLPEEICPPEAQGKSLALRRVEYRQVEGNLLAAMAAQKRLVLPDPSEEAEASIGTEELRDGLERVLKTLTYREREILKMRYGLGEDGFSYTYEEIGRVFKVTRGRVQQVERTALRKLQHPVRARKLEGFIDKEERDRRDPGER